MNAPNIPIFLSCQIFSIMTNSLAIDQNFEGPFNVIRYIKPFPRNKIMVVDLKPVAIEKKSSEESFNY